MLPLKHDHSHVPIKTSRQEHSCVMCTITLLGKLSITTTASDISNKPDSRLKFLAETSIFFLVASTGTFWGPHGLLCLVGAGDNIGAL